jgi:hypothetical protein
MHSPTPFKLHKLTDWLFTESAAGIQVSGDSGSGKSNVLEVLAQHFAEQGLPFLFLDPHGSSAKRIERFASSLPQRLRRKFLVIRPTDLRQLVTINPLSVPLEGCTDLEWRARIINKVGHMSHILLSAWGEVDFNSRPRMYTWVTRILKTLASCGLTLPDARYFLDVGSPLFQALIRAVPDLMARNAFEDLARRRPSEADEQIESTRTRILGFLDNPVVEAMLGRADGLDFRQLIRDGMSIIVDLEPRGLLRDEDQTILANLILTEFVHTVMNLPAAERRPYFVFVDELPVFAQASGPLLIRALCEIRKFLTRFILAHQGTQRFPERTDDPFLNTIVSQCGVHVYLRHINPKDATFFGEILALPDLDPLRVKHEQQTPMQFQDGHDLVVLTDTSEGSSTAEQHGTSQTTGTTDSTSQSEGRTDGDGSSSGTSTQRDEDRLRETVNQARSKTSARTSNSNTSSATSSQNGTSASTTTSHTFGKTHKQTLVPRIVTRNIVMSVQFYSLEEQRQVPATKLAGLRTGAAFLHVSGRGVAEVGFPLARDPFVGIPKFAKRKEAEFWQDLLARPEYAAPASILKARQRMLDELLVQLQRLAPFESLVLGPANQRHISERQSPTEGASARLRPAEAPVLLPLEEDEPNAPWRI